MKTIEGLDLKALAEQADKEFLAEQGEQVKRQIRNVNSEINSLLVKKGQLEAEISTVSKRLQEAIGRKEKIMNGDWSAVPENKEPSRVDTVMKDNKKDQKEKE